MLNPPTDAGRPEQSEQAEQSGPRLVVGIGASAGGLEALEQFFAHMPVDSGAAFIVVTHLAPHLPSLMAELLAKQTAMPVVQATDGVTLAANHVYVIPPDSTLTLAGGALRLGARAASHDPIDSLFRSLAEDRAESAIGIVLSGTGSDGSLGLRAIKAHAGMAMVQEPTSAKYDTMPRSAIAAAMVDWILPVEAMPAKLVEYIAHIPSSAARAPAAADPRDEPREDEALIQRLCALIQRKTGHDFSRYKRSTLVRRIQRRMHVMLQGSLAEYVDLLAARPAEVERLFQDLLIGVTQFFRDPEVFELLARDIVPRIVADREPDDPVRVWVPGCATGEEAYSLAILLAEALPPGSPQVKIFATDIDDEALEVARRGRYPKAIVEQISPERLERFFIPHQGGGWQVRKDIRDMCVFSTHNIITDPPFSRIDLVSCRNLLIYLEGDLQQAIFPLFHYALRPGCFLLLGPSESVTTRPELFTKVDAKHRIFRRQETAVPIKVPLTGPRQFDRRAVKAPPGHSPVGEDSLSRRIERLILAAFALPAVVVREGGEIVFVAGQTRRYLELAPGSAAVNVRDMASKELRPHLHVLLHEASTRHQERVHKGVTLTVGGEVRRVDIVVRPLDELGPDANLYAVVFREEGPPLTAEEVEGRTASADGSLVEALELELRSTRENLQSTVEELEVSNEELKSMNEELLSTNEELQSSNEELQTSKEELQSINEELQTVNAELSRKINDLDKAHGDLQNLFASTRIATVFLGRDLTVKSFSPAATLLFRLIDSDIGRPVTDIVRAFTSADLVAEVEEVLRTHTPSQREVRTNLDVWYLQRLQPYLTNEGEVIGVVLTFVDITDLKVARDDARRLAAIVESSHDAILRLGAGHEIETWNRGAEQMFGYTAAEMTGQKIERLLGHDISSPIAAVLRGERVAPIDVVIHAKDRSPIRVLASMSPIHDAGGQQVVAVSWIARDITEQEQHRADLRETEERFHEVNEADRRKTEFLALLAHELRNPLTPIRNAVHLLRHPRTPATEARKAVAMVERQVTHMARLVDDLMDVSRISSGKLLIRREHQDLVELVRAVVGDHKAEASRDGVSVTCTAGDESLWVMGDETRLSQCVGNILANAIKFTDRGGTIAVTLAREGDTAVVRVRDSGVGMDAETLERAFEAFAQADRHVARGRGGLGLGLSLVKALVELHGGTVTATSAGPGRGTEVAMRLPLAQRPARVASPRDVEHKPCEPRHVLVIEDNVDAAESTRALLEMWGHTAAVAGSGAEGVEAALRDPPDLVLCDLSLNGEMNGYDVCRALRAAPTTASSRIIAVTGHSLDSDKQRVRDAGFDQHLIKPVDPNILAQIVDASPPRPSAAHPAPMCE